MKYALLIREDGRPILSSRPVGWGYGQFGTDDRGSFPAERVVAVYPSQVEMDADYERAFAAIHRYGDRNRLPHPAPRSSLAFHLSWDPQTNVWPPHRSSILSILRIGALDSYTADFVQRKRPIWFEELTAKLHERYAHRFFVEQQTPATVAYALKSAILVMWRDFIEPSRITVKYEGSLDDPNK